MKTERKPITDCAELIRAMLHHAQNVIIPDYHAVAGEQDTFGETAYVYELLGDAFIDAAQKLKLSTQTFDKILNEVTHQLTGEFPKP